MPTGARTPIQALRLMTMGALISAIFAGLCLADLVTSGAIWDAAGLGLAATGLAIGAMVALGFVIAMTVPGMAPDARRGAVRAGTAAGILSVAILPFDGAAGFGFLLPVPLAFIAFYVGAVAGLFGWDEREDA